MARGFKIVAIGAALALALGLWVVVLMTDDTVALRAGSQGRDAAGGYDVTMSPVGTVHFDREPRRVVTRDPNYNDMLVAVGAQRRLAATGSPHFFYEGYYRQLPGVDWAVSTEALTYMSGADGVQFDKELLYRLAADVHHIDPLRMAGMFGWTKADIDEIARNVGPFFANRYSRTNDYPGDEPYAYYTAWQLSDKIAQVYRRPRVIEQLQTVCDAMVDDIRAKLPPIGQRPRVALITSNGQGRFMPFSFTGKGFGTAQYAAVGARDAFAPIRDATYNDAARGTWLDVEGLLAIDPDVIIVPWAIYERGPVSMRGVLDLVDDPVGRRLTAVKNGRIHPGGTPLQGPIFYLFQVEMAAKQIYPERFGLYRHDQQYPADEQLFDRAQVARLIHEAASRGQDEQR